MISEEDNDCFQVSVEPLALTGDEAEDAERFRLTVLRVYRNDPQHAVQYKVGDVFEVLRTAVWSGDWTLSEE